MPLSLKMSGKGLLKIQDYVDGMAERAADMAPAWVKITTIIETMLAAVWAGSGMAPEFGMESSWASLQDSTVTRRASYPTPQAATPVLAFGFLRAAAISPVVATSDKGTILNINPATRGAPANYARGNYAKFLASGTSQGAPPRPFFMVTPQLLEMVKEVMISYILVEDTSIDEDKPDAPSADFTDREHRRRRIGSSSDDDAKAYARWKGKTRDGVNYADTSAESQALQAEYHNVSAAERKLGRMSGIQTRSAEGRNVMQEATGESNPNAYIGKLSNVLEFQSATREGRA